MFEKVSRSQSMIQIIIFGPQTLHKHIYIYIYTRANTFIKQGLGRALDLHANGASLLTN